MDEAGQVPELTGVRVLVADDDSEARELLTAMLQQYGASVTAVPSGRDALETIARDGADVLLSDIQMPEEDGDWLIAQLRGLQDRRRPQLPAIAVTAYGGSEERQRLLAAGFQRHVAKPVDAEKLASVVAELVARRRS